MNKYILFLFLLLPLAHADELDCEKAKTVLEINECVADKLKTAHTKMREYLDASITRHSEDIIVTEAIKQAQRAWMKYMELHCDSVYSLWREGSIRNVMYLFCQISLTEERTYELWSQYLKLQDNSTPTLPQPIKPAK